MLLCPFIRQPTVCHKISGNKRNVKSLGEMYNKVLSRAHDATQLIEPLGHYYAHADFDRMTAHGVWLIIKWHLNPFPSL